MTADLDGPASYQLFPFTRRPRRGDPSKLTTTTKYIWQYAAAALHSADGAVLEYGEQNLPPSIPVEAARAAAAEARAANVCPPKAVDKIDR